MLNTGFAHDLFGDDKNLESSNYSILSFIVLGIAEELIFRGPLKYKTITLPFLLFIIFLVPLAILRKSLELDSITAKITVFLIPLLIVTPLFFYIRKSDLGTKLKFFWEKKFRYIFYGSAFLFAFVHSIEWNIVSAVTLLGALLFSVPHLVSGLTLGYARMKIGLWAAIFIHIIFNISIDYVWDFGDYLLSLF